MSDECRYHPQLMETLGGLKADTSWLKTAFWTIPASIICIAISIVTCFMSNERRITALETRIATQITNGDMPRWTTTQTLKNHK